jgi:predicted ATP-dependent protease
MKFTDDELSTIKKLQTRYADIVRKIGQNELQIHDIQKVLEDLETQREKLFQEYQQAKDDEQNLVNTFTVKYGEGTIDINTGNFTPSNPEEN